MVMWKDSETVVDYLKFDYIIDAVTKIVLDEGLSPSSIGLYGDWGSGKSSLMKMIEQKLTQRGDKSILCVRFNGWLLKDMKMQRRLFVERFLKNKGKGNFKL